MSTSWDRYSATRQNKSFEKPAPSDRAAYISYLEVQVDKLNQSLQKNQDNPEINLRVQQLDDRLLNTTKLIKLQQEYSEQQESEMNKMRCKVEQLGQLSIRIEVLEKQERMPVEQAASDSVDYGSLSEVAGRLKADMNRLETKLKSQYSYDLESVKKLERDLNKQVKQMSEAQADVIDRSDLDKIKDIAQNAEDTCTRLAGDCMKRIQDVKSEVAKLGKGKSAGKSVIDTKISESIQNINKLMKRYTDKTDRLSDKVRLISARKHASPIKQEIASLRDSFGSRPQSQSMVLSPEKVIDVSSSPKQRNISETPKFSRSKKKSLKRSNSTNSLTQTRKRGDEEKAKRIVKKRGQPVVQARKQRTVRTPSKKLKS